MYIDIKQLKARQAKAVATKAGPDIIKSIIDTIENAANEGKGEVKIVYNDYNINSHNLPYVCHWARLCEFSIITYSDVMYINW